MKKLLLLLLLLPNLVFTRHHWPDQSEYGYAGGGSSGFFDVIGGIFAVVAVLFIYFLFFKGIDESQNKQERMKDGEARQWQCGGATARLEATS